MITRTIELVEKNFDIVVEVTKDCQVIEANMIVIHMEDNPIECAHSVRHSEYFMNRIKEQFVHLDWSNGDDDHAEESWSIESLKESMIQILGVKPA